MRTLPYLAHRADSDAKLELDRPTKLTKSTEVFFQFNGEPDDALANALFASAIFWKSRMWVTANIYGDKGRTFAAGSAVGDEILDVLQEQFGDPASVQSTLLPDRVLLCKVVGVRSRYMVFETADGHVCAFFRKDKDAVQAILALSQFSPGMQRIPTAAAA